MEHHYFSQLLLQPPHQLLHAPHPRCYPIIARVTILQSKSNHNSRPFTSFPYIPAKLIFPSSRSSAPSLPQDPSTYCFSYLETGMEVFSYQVNSNRSWNLSLSVTFPKRPTLTSPINHTLQPLNSLLKYLAHI